MENGKNRRSFNFTQPEVETLISLVEKYKNSIENKESDAISWQEKNVAWDKLRNDFNQMGFNIRTTKQLREKWINIKKESKKKFAAERNEIYKTGGGTKTEIIITEIDEKVKGIIGAAVTGLDNYCDGDGILYQDKNTETIEQLESATNEPVTDVAKENSSGAWGKWNPKILKGPLSEKLNVNSGILTEFGPNWNPSKKEATVMDAKQSLSSDIRCVNTTNFKTLVLKLVNPNRVKATHMNQIEKNITEPSCSSQHISENSEFEGYKEATPLKRSLEFHQGDTPKSKCQKTSTSNNLKKKSQLTADCRIKINTLSEAKLELIQVQKECLLKDKLMKEEEHELNVMQSRAEHDIKMKKHILELQILQRQLDSE